jgi:hypothetical protein
MDNQDADMGQQRMKTFDMLHDGNELSTHTRRALTALSGIADCFS